MRLRLDDRRLLSIAIAAAAGGLAVSVFYVRFLGGLAFCAGEWARICWVGLGSATLLFLCGAGIRGMASSWLRVRSREFRRLYALNVLLGLATAASCVWLLWSLLAGPVDGAGYAGGVLLLMLGALLFLNHAAEDDRRRQMAGLARRLGLAFKPRDSFESEEFNRHYGVWASDRKFAYDVVDPRMMEFLLANPGWAFEVAGPDVMVYTGKRWAPGQFGPAIRALTGFVERIPAHVLANWRGLAREVFGDKAMAGAPGAGEDEPG